MRTTLIRCNTVLFLLGIGLLEGGLGHGATGSTPAAAELKLIETPAAPNEWGYRPKDGAEVDVNPPTFSWRPNKGIVSWEIECGEGDAFKTIAYQVDDVGYNVHCPSRTFSPGDYSWRYRGVDAAGRKTAWSRARRFTIGDGLPTMPMPTRGELLGRIPTAHPRLFVRPEELPRLRELAKGPLKVQYDALVATCERLLKKPPPTEEPPRYPASAPRKSEAWRKIWWGNRTYTIAALNSAATLGFTRLVGGKEEYGQLAKRILLDCAKWDPKGATGYRYNDEAGMPYAYYFARTYTFVHDLLTTEERETCRRVLRIRGEEMYRHLCPNHLWRPYSSHSNRAWHFLGEVGIALHGEVEEADEWTWFATSVFFNAYPVWSDADGGWHEGLLYWNSYVNRFTWWADVMRAALRIDAFDKPYFARVGYYPMYLMPPGKLGGGFGDLNAKRTARSNVPLVSQLAAQSGNSHWQWYVEQMGGPSKASGYIGFVRGALPIVEPQAPSDLPASRLFRGTGQACLNTTLEDANDGVQVVFKSSPFGTQSHGYESNNSFLLWAYGQRLLIRSGYRDIYASDHHVKWMWSTRSTNCITIGGHGQTGHSASAQGKIVAFKTTPDVDILIGEAADAYRNRAGDKPVERFTRAIVFVKPDVVIVYDRLAAKEPSTFEYWLHATQKFHVSDQSNIDLRVGDVGCRISMLRPQGLEFSQTNQYDPNPRPRVTLREWHLTATTPSKTQAAEFIAIYSPHRIGNGLSKSTSLREDSNTYYLTVSSTDRATASVQLPKATGTLLVEYAKTPTTLGRTITLTEAVD